MMTHADKAKIAMQEEIQHLEHSISYHKNKIEFFEAALKKLAGTNRTATIMMIKDELKQHNDHLDILEYELDHLINL